MYPPRRCHYPCPYLCPAGKVSAFSAKYRCLPADASWSAELHGCHRLLVCYGERRPLPLLLSFVTLLCGRGGGNVVHGARRLASLVSGRLSRNWCCCGGVVVRLCVFVCFGGPVAPSLRESQHMIDRSGRGNPRRVRRAHGVWIEQPPGTTSTPPCHRIRNRADMPWLGAGRGP